MSALGLSRGVRLAELVASLSLATDLGLGQPLEHVLRSTRIALMLGEDMGLDDEERSVLFYAGLLFWVSCHADSHDQARWFGDDIALRADSYKVDQTGLAQVGFVIGHLGAGSSPLRRAATTASFLSGGYRAVEGFEVTACVLAATFARRLGLDADVEQALRQSFERWDGKGVPDHLEGEQICLPARLLHLAFVAEVLLRELGAKGAVDAVRQRSGTQLDPGLVDRFAERAEGLLGVLDSAPSWEAVIDAEPALVRVLDEARLDEALEAVADFTDLKSPFTAGHSRGVAALAAGAARALGMLAADVTLVRRAGLVHDLGKVGISNAIWDKPGPLTSVELERVRLHPYLTQRTLSFSPRLAVLGSIASQHHERLDGSGYPQGLSGSSLGPPARLLAAADVYHAMTEPRPHRPARPAETAAAELRLEARGGRLDGEAVNAVLMAAGQRVRARPERPGGLTPREVEVLALLARGMSNKEIAAELVITPKTAANHVQHIYSKIEVTSRAGASLFAMQHGLVGALEP